MRTLTTLSHTQAQRAITAVQQELERRGKAATVAVGDAHGELIALLRVGDALLPSINVATNKVHTAARERKATKVLGASVRHPETGFDINYFGDLRYVGWGGGLPVIHEGKVVGAVAVSGLSEEEDAEIAQIGIDALGD